jgi:hypothetical protein
MLTRYLVIMFVVVEKLLVGHKLNMCPIWLFVDRNNYSSFLTLMFSKDKLIKKLTSFIKKWLWLNYIILYGIKTKTLGKTLKTY